MRVHHSRFVPGDLVASWGEVWDERGRRIEPGRVWTVLEACWSIEFATWTYLLVDSRGLVPRRTVGRDDELPHLERAVLERDLARVRRR